MRSNVQESANREKLWTVGFVLICLVAIIQRTGTQMQNTVLPLFIQGIGYTKAAAGNCNAAYSFASLFCRPFMGKAVDRFGSKRILVLGTVFLALTVLGYCFTDSLIWIFVLRILGGIAFSATTVAVSTASVQAIAESRMTEGIGYFGLSSALAQSIGPVVALALIGGDAYWLCFTIIALLLGVATLLVLFIRQPTGPEPGQKPASPPAREGSLLNAIVEPTAMMPSILSFLVFFSSNSVGTFLSTYTKEAILDGVSQFFVIKALSIAFSRILIRPIQKHLGNEGGLLSAFGLYAVNFFLIFTAKGKIVLWTAAVLFGFGYGLLQTLLNAAAVINTPRSRRGAANATYYMAMDLGLGIGASCWGYVADWFGTRSIYMGAMLVQVLAIAVYFILKRKYGQFVEKVDRGI